MALYGTEGQRFESSRARSRWYERLFGEPSFFPHDTEAVWTIAEDRSVYVVEHPDETYSNGELGFGGAPLDTA